MQADVKTARFGLPCPGVRRGKATIGLFLIQQAVQIRLVKRGTRTEDHNVRGAAYLAGVVGKSAVERRGQRLPACIATGDDKVPGLAVHRRRRETQHGLQVVQHAAGNFAGLIEGLAGTACCGDLSNVHERRPFHRYLYWRITASAAAGRIALRATSVSDRHYHPRFQIACPTTPPHPSASSRTSNPSRNVPGCTPGRPVRPISCRKSSTTPPMRHWPVSPRRFQCALRPTG
ncbi:hypothetical protein SDC9_148837 [bioreactor metagenome]|uniref:Uncharacterized protein n=1 Tax=bioreactor metagenome TaxID=1076179 RepID=A0A645EIP6_9ZZZZ